jgi:hypothetical protein
MADGTHLEFSMAQHARAAGDNTAVRWWKHAATGPGTWGEFWPGNDTQIFESDNGATLYLPWLNWTVYWLRKIINIGSPPTAVYRDGQPGASNALFLSHFDNVDSAGYGQDGYINHTFNPACLVNPPPNMSCWFGGAPYLNLRDSRYPNIMVVFDPNPNYPAKSSAEVRMRTIGHGFGPSPCIMRHPVRIGNWIYWGSSYIRDQGGRSNEFYRIYIPDLLLNARVTQERLPDAPFSPAAVSGYFELLAVDEPRKRVIAVNEAGVFRYQVPANDGPDGTWSGPFAPANWLGTLTDNLVPKIQWYGCIGSHRSDLNMTFVRYNLLRKWVRITWAD